MKKFLLALLGLFAVATLPAKGALNVSVFYDSLDPYGEWLDVEDYGYVWHPADVEETWRPYTVGHWVFTDAGWTWMSDEPFGWATYHYGRWVNVVSTGWVWVPDTEWGPAWVSWRRSPRHVGWAPLPPEARFRQNIAISSWADSYYDIGPGYYNFVEVRQFGAPRLREVVLPPRENVTIINETRNITNITYRNKIVHNGGPEYDVIVRESAQPIRRLKLDRRTDFDASPGALRADALRPQIQGDALRVAAPTIDATSAAPRRVARKVEKMEVNRGWKEIADKGQADQLRARMKAEARPPAELPAQPKFERAVAKEDRSNKAATKPNETADAPPVTTAPGTATAPSDKTAATAEKPLPPEDPSTAATAAGDRLGRKAKAKKGAANVTTDPGVAPATGDPTAQSGKGYRKGRKAGTPADPTVPGVPETSDTTDREVPAGARATAGKASRAVAPNAVSDVDASATSPPEDTRSGRKRAKAPASQPGSAELPPAPASHNEEPPRNKAGDRRESGPASDRQARGTREVNSGQPRAGSAKGRGDGDRKKAKKEGEEQ